MTRDELLALMPEDKPAPLDETFYRDLHNHWSTWGADGLVRKRGRGWVVEFRGHGHPTIFKTKREACDMANRWVMATEKNWRVK